MVHEQIEQSQGLVGKPVIRGTRLTVELILRKLGAGMTADEIIADHPRLTIEASAPPRLSPLTILRTKN